jgi:hypothetical protein
MEVIRREAMQSHRANFDESRIANERALILGSCLSLRRLRQPSASYACATGSCIIAQMKPTNSRATAAITSDFGFCRAQRR